MIKLHQAYYLWVLLLGCGGAVLLLNLTAHQVQAHPQAGQIRYVAATGQDQGTCLDPELPCKTLLYAIRQANKGDEIRVAQGAYMLPANYIDVVLNAFTPVQGGYNRLDYFSIQDPARNPTYLLGPTFEHRTGLHQQGFQLVTDAKGLHLVGPTLPEPESRNRLNQTAATCENGLADIYPCENVDLLGHIALSKFSSNPADANDVWGFVDLNDNREYAIIGLRNGTAVVDVTDPASPVEVGIIPGKNAIWRDVKVYQFFNVAEGRWNAYAYITADMVVQGLQIIDLTALPQAVSLANTYTDFVRAHNIYISDVDYTSGITRSGTSAYAFILGSELNQGAFRILDLQNPITPTLVTPPQSGMQYAHDVTTLVITDTRTADCHLGHNPCELIVDFNENTVDIWDVTVKETPFKLSSTSYAGAAYTHSGWWSQDKQFVFVQDESDERAGNNTTLRTLDISDLTAPQISHVWHGSTRAIDHNGFTKGDRYYMSNYERGLTIFDVTTPNDPQIVGFFDTYPDRDDQFYNGAWGVYPYLPSGTILISDIQRGLLLVKEKDSKPEVDGSPLINVSLQVNTPTVAIGETITYTYQITNTSTLTLAVQAVDNRLGKVPLKINAGTATFLLPHLAPQAAAVGFLTDTITLTHLPNPLSNTVIVTATTSSMPISTTVVQTTVNTMIVEPSFQMLYLPILLKRDN